MPITFPIYASKSLAHMLSLSHNPRSESWCCVEDAPSILPQMKMTVNPKLETCILSNSSARMKSQIPDPFDASLTKATSVDASRASRNWLVRASFARKKRNEKHKFPDRPRAVESLRSPWPEEISRASKKKERREVMNIAGSVLAPQCNVHEDLENNAAPSFRRLRFRRSALRDLHMRCRCSSSWCIHTF